MKFILGALVWVLVFILLFLPLTVLWIVKLIVTAINFCFGYTDADDNKCKVKSLTSFDFSIFPNSSWQKPINHVGFILKVDGAISANDFREHFAKCFNLNESVSDNSLDKYERFYSFLFTRCGYTFRAHTKAVNLEEHIKEQKLQHVSSENTNESLEQFTSRWFLPEYSVKKPCWEVAVVPNSKETIIAFKIHHGLCDGYSILHIVDTLTGAKSPYLVKPFTDSFFGKVKYVLEGPINLIQYGALPKETNPFRQEISNTEKPEVGWLFSFTQLPLANLKILRMKHGNVRMAAVVWTIISGGIRRFLEEELRKTVDEIPEMVMVVNTFPWPEHPAMINETRNKDRLRNHWASGYLKVPLREPDAKVRIGLIEKEYSSFLSLALDRCLYPVMSPLLWCMPTGVLAKSVLKDTGALTASLTSLIGADSYSLLGNPISEVHFLKGIQYDGRFPAVSCFTLSHSGKMELTLSTNPNQCVLNNQEILDSICHKYIQDEFQQFWTLTENTL